MGFSEDKRLKTDKPLGTIYSSHKPHLIKVTNTARSETTRADEIAIQTTKTSKVTAVIAVMSIFSKKRCKLWSTNHRNEKPSCQKVESADIPEGNTHGSRSLSQKLRKGQRQMKLVPKSKKLELNSTNLKMCFFPG